MASSKVSRRGVSKPSPIYFRVATTASASSAGTSCSALNVSRLSFYLTLPTSRKICCTCPDNCLAEQHGMIFPFCQEKWCPAFVNQMECVRKNQFISLFVFDNFGIYVLDRSSCRMICRSESRDHTVRKGLLFSKAFFIYKIPD